MCIPKTAKDTGGKRYRQAVDESKTTAQAENLKVRSLLMVAIRDRIDEFGWSQRVAANHLGVVTQPRISELESGKVSRFSIDVLVNLATRVGLTVQVNVVPTSRAIAWSATAITSATS